MKSIRSCLGIVCTASLVACGGGGGGASAEGGAVSGGLVASNLSFPLRAGFQSELSQASSNSFTITGSCSGAATETDSAASATTFEGQPSMATTSTVTGTFSNCTPASFASTGRDYYDTNYKPIGSENIGTEYSVYSTSTDLPVSVAVGNTAQFAVADVYTSNTKATRIGTTNISYVIEADSATTAIVNVIAKRYNTSSQLLFTQQTRYRINASGQLTALSKDVQYSTTSTAHLLWTKN